MIILRANHRSSVRILLMTFVCIPLVSCVSVDFQEPVSKFSGSMATANAIIGNYFTEMNEFEREMYLQQALYDASAEIGHIDSSGKRTGLLPYFSAESTKARLDSLSLLTVYGERLTALAGADAPTEFNTGAQVLGANLEGLASTFTDLTKGGADETADQYVGPITTVLGVLGEMYLDNRRDEAISEAVNKGAPAVNMILDLIEADLTSVVDPLLETGLLEQLALSTSYYNNNRGSISFAQREALLRQIDSFATRYQVAATARPSEAVSGIRGAHSALVKYANSSKEPEDLASLSAAIETFNNRLRPLVESLAKLEEEET